MIQDAINHFQEHILKEDLETKELYEIDFYSPYLSYDKKYKGEYKFLLESVNYSYNVNVVKRSLQNIELDYNINDISVIDRYYPQLLNNIKKSTKDTIFYIKNTYNLASWQIYIDDRELQNKIYYDELNDIKYSSSYLYIFIPNVGKNKEKICNMMESFGYFLSLTKNNNSIFHDKYGKLLNWIMLRFEPKHELLVNRYVKWQAKLYHVSPSYNRNKILSKGLIPKDKNDRLKTDGRIYLLLQLDFNNKVININRIKNVIYQLYNTKKDKEHIKEYDIYEINVTNLDINFSIDHNINNEAVYTYDNIPPSNIKLINTIRI